MPERARIDAAPAVVFRGLTENDESVNESVEVPVSVVKFFEQLEE